MAQSPKRINIDVSDIRPLLDTIATMSGNSLSGFCANLIKKALKDFLMEKSLPEIIDILDPQILSKNAVINEDRIADLALGDSAPTNAELIRIARELRTVGISASDLQAKRDREYSNYNKEQPQTQPKKNDSECECL